MNFDPADTAKVQREMYSALKARREALEDILRKKTEELKTLCIKEGVRFSHIIQYLKYFQFSLLSWINSGVTKEKDNCYLSPILPILKLKMHENLTFFLTEIMIWI